MTDIEYAKKRLNSGSYSCVLVKNDIIYTSTLSGISPLVTFLDAGTDLKGFSAADKIIGKAAALLFVLAGVREVYGQTMSERAAAVLKRYGIVFSYGSLIPEIINRQGTGMCPMEKTVLDTEEPSVALTALKQTMARLKAGNIKNNGFPAV
jgi:hypothetical protein